jgi:hypothetical protein
VVCLKLICEPVTLPCGHAFCRACVAASAAAELGRGARCPVCRHPLPPGAPPAAVSLLLASLLQRRVARQRAARARSSFTHDALP